MLDRTLYIILPLLCGWILDKIFGDPESLPHPVVGFGKLISFSEKRLNKGSHLVFKGAILAISLVAITYLTTWYLLCIPGVYGGPAIIISTILVFFSLSGRTLIREAKEVFAATDRSLEEGRRQVSRIVGRDTSGLSGQQIKKAALETLAENLNDGVIAPLFWYLVLGIPGMVAYKMVNTLDSMIGYKNKRYILFGRFAAKMDDVANYIPARLTALLMLLAGMNLKPESFAESASFVRKYSACHTSPNSGYPESALAAILGCRFGGPAYYFGELVNKPFIGEVNKPFGQDDLSKAICVNRRAEVMMIMIIIVVNLILAYYA